MDAYYLRWAFIIFIPEIVRALQFASYYHDHMVLTRAPDTAVIWGYGTKIGDPVNVAVSGYKSVQTKIVKQANSPEGIWTVKLTPITKTGPFNVTATAPEGAIVLTDVVFGDVWMCIGQTDMAFPVSQVINSTYEIKKAADFQLVRLFKPATVKSTTPLEDISQTDVSWSLPSYESLYNFSAVCWFFGEYLYPVTDRAIGLIQVTFPEFSGPVQSSVPPIESCYWNGMIYPLARMAIYGVLWYQGQGNLVVNYDYGYDFTVLTSGICTTPGV